MDVVTGFLNGELLEVVHNVKPHGLEKGDPSKIVSRLKKSIYRLKQAPLQWYAKIDDFLVRCLGMQCNLADDCVYVWLKGSTFSSPRCMWMTFCSQAMMIPEVE